VAAACLHWFSRFIKIRFICCMIFCFFFLFLNCEIVYYIRIDNFWNFYNTFGFRIIKKFVCSFINCIFEADIIINLFFIIGTIVESQSRFQNIIFIVLGLFSFWLFLNARNDFYRLRFLLSFFLGVIPR
jgi:hypothetical protein